MPRQNKQKSRYVAELKNTRDSLNKSKKLLLAINRAQSEFIADVSTRTLFDNLLNDLLLITASEYGFIGEVLYTDKGNPYLKTHAITNIAWNRETREFYEQNAPHGMEFSNLKTLFGRVLTTGKPVIANSPASDPRAGGIPDGHPPLKAFLGIPFSIGDTLIGLVGIANCPNGYDEEILEFLSPLLVTCARIFDSYRQEQKRLKTEEDLRKKEDLHREAQSIAHIGHWELNLHTNELVWSDEQYNIFGIDREKCKVSSYETFLDIVHPDDRALVDGTYRDSVKNKKKYDIIHRIGTRESGVKYLHERWRTEYDETGAPIRSIGTTQDITPLKETEIEKGKIEQQLRQTQKMEAIGTLASGIAHDFNNLLNAIVGFADLLLMDLQEGSRQHKDAQQIKNAGKRATELVQQILTFSRRSEQKWQPLKLQQVIKEALKLLRSSLPTTVEIRQDIHPDCSSVIADFTQIHQVIMNLCTNAFHAIGQKKGILEVRLDEISVDPKLAGQIQDLSAGKYIRLIVKDSGQGMDQVTRERIFDPYFTTKKKGSGTGLGLATVLGIVKSHKGAITVHSKKGQGSTFTLYFPVATDDNTPVQKSEVQTELPWLGARVLFVDDIEFNVLLGKNVLERLGCNTLGVTSSIEALALFRKDPDKFDIIITDQTMPALTGYELAQKILKIRPKMPIIILTGHSDSLDNQKAKKIGIYNLLMKPLDMNKLVESMCKLLM
ncbi:MAG: response regulator [Desulfobulbaceae bacterium]|nr:response regulator [Desulfobulbaceae bacterium]